MDVLAMFVLGTVSGHHGDSTRRRKFHRIAADQQEDSALIEQADASGQGKGIRHGLVYSISYREKSCWLHLNPPNTHRWAQ
jgi:hypothetical protein